MAFTSLFNSLFKLATVGYCRKPLPEDDQDVVCGQISPILTSVLDGYNVCIFSYGQAGTGKNNLEGFGHLQLVGDKASKRGHRGEEDLGLVEARVDDTDAVWKLIRGEAKAIILGSVSKDNEDCPCVAKFEVESEDNICLDDFIKLDICAIGVDLLVAPS
ncbi:hypothetical protein Vadar_015350 [Vaccinium darrowii]|uniref:Uncharacterized protein n=1 Tax=Vaccinium darrowii TaxID=229202 RepID=A0ACB7X0U3_9ERIC|nr:hypothetical protein Vadar_015350 [Vaccinium darrowii]